VIGAADTDAIVATVNDYFEGWFTGDVTRMERALHPDLAKRGLQRGVLEGDTTESMISATGAGIGTRHDPSRRSIAIDVVHVHEDIATATVTGPIYVEYLHLGRIGGRWQIVNALWSPADATQA
jgi:hypothetical protein